MSDIFFGCRHCGQDLEAPEEMAGDRIACPSCEKPIQVPVGKAKVARVSVTRGGSLFGRIVAGVIGGFMVGALASNIFMLTFADPMKTESGPVVSTVSGVLFIGLWIGAVVLAIRSMWAARAWRRVLIPSGILSLVLPIAALIMTSRAAAATAAKGGQMADLAAGATAVGGTLFAIVVGFFGVILGAIFLTIGLLVGKEPRS